MNQMSKMMTMHLTKAARSKGGDRYEAHIEGEDRPIVIYWPQSISRDETGIKQSLTVTVED